MNLLSKTSLGVIVALAAACALLYWQNWRKDTTISQQITEIATLKGAVESKDLLINEKTMSSNLADLLSQERKTADELRDAYRRDMRAALKEVVMNDEDVRKWIVDLWPAPVLGLLDETRNRLFPGNSKTGSPKSTAPGNAMPATGGKQ